MGVKGVAPWGAGAAVVFRCLHRLVQRQQSSWRPSRLRTRAGEYPQKGNCGGGEEFLCLLYVYNILFIIVLVSQARGGVAGAKRGRGA